MRNSCKEVFVLLVAAAGLAAGILRSSGAGSADTAKAKKSIQEEKDPYEAQASYDYPHYYHGDGYGYHHHHVSHVNDDAVKGLLIPLAGIALLGAAAIAASNPVLLQIGVVGGSIGKKRRRRELPSERGEDLRVLETFLHQIPQRVVAAEEKKLQASYILCSGIGEKSNSCFERVTCEMSSPASNSTQFERKVLDIVLTDIMKNEFLPKDMKQRIHEAHKTGLQSRNCLQYYCREIDQGSNLE